MSDQQTTVATNSSTVAVDDKTLIAETKAELKAHLPLDFEETVWKDVLERVQVRAKEIQSLGSAAIPQVHISKLQQNPSHDDPEMLLLREEIHRAGVVVIRGVFDQAQVEQWNQDLQEYIHKNDYIQVAAAARNNGQDNIEQYFSSSTGNGDDDAQKPPQMYDVYWSKAQVQARQHPNLKVARDYLNQLWRYNNMHDNNNNNNNNNASEQENDAETTEQKKETEWFFDPTQQIEYCDRVRMRQPGDDTLGLAPHLDAGSIERWVERQGYQKVYQRLFVRQGQQQQHDPWDGEHRVKAREFPAPNVCTAFRTWQGWTALTRQGPGDGTLQVVPMLPEAIAYIMLRPLLSDVPDDDLCGARRAASLPILPTWHAPLLDGLVSIPTVEPGDAVWWHPDVVHAVESEHSGDGYSNVLYMGAAPLCDKNARYLQRQREHFQQHGKTPPDFCQGGIEVGFTTQKATPDDLSDLGRLQMGFSTAWSTSSAAMDEKDEGRCQLWEKASRLLFLDA
ncbi:Protein of unknown function (DUF1479) [Seminavis robusta]|uniref:DUF1479-domain-containing protein n=1 Tax=Seminavis robusta TaxID=568900 RepID=A0A9N8EWY4_9STRA|nr:Protein of unknown function (DUF1479) [Seminavis robusta]|eukprot:Sro2005_g310510.1 Protein of unknown function (DUF1479) (507) ;mRNA; f:12911-14431